MCGVPPLPLPSPLLANSISNSSSSRVTGTLQIVQSAPTPGPPHVRSGKRLGSVPAWITSRAFSRRTGSSLIQLIERQAKLGGLADRKKIARHLGLRLKSPILRYSIGVWTVPQGEDERMADFGVLIPTLESIMSGRPETGPLLTMAERAEAAGFD